MSLGPETALLLSGGLSAAGSALAGSGGQELAGFRDPQGDLDLARGFLLDAGGAYRNIAARPAMTPGAFVGTLPTFVNPSGSSGASRVGGLPMPIGVTGRDPALFDPQAFLTRPGISGDQAQLPTGEGFTPSPPPQQRGGGGDTPLNLRGLTGQSTFSAPTQGPSLRGGDDTMQAAAALNLLFPSQRRA